MKYLLAIIAILFLLVGIPVIQDTRDRSFLCEQLSVSRKDISRQFFHLEGKGPRVYYVKEHRYLVTGIFWLELYK